MRNQGSIVVGVLVFVAILAGITAAIFMSRNRDDRLRPVQKVTSTLTVSPAILFDKQPCTNMMVTWSIQPGEEVVTNIALEYFTATDPSATLLLSTNRAGSLPLNAFVDLKDHSHLSQYVTLRYEGSISGSRNVRHDLRFYASDNNLSGCDGRGGTDGHMFIQDDFVPVPDPKYLGARSMPYAIIFSPFEEDPPDNVIVGFTFFRKVYRVCPKHTVLKGFMLARHQNLRPEETVAVRLEMPPGNVIGEGEVRDRAYYLDLPTPLPIDAPLVAHYTVYTTNDVWLEEHSGPGDFVLITAPSGSFCLDQVSP